MIDRMDQGTRVDDALKDFVRKDYDDEPNVRIFVPTGSLPFFKHLITAMTFQNSLFAYGRCELFVCLPPPLYIVRSLKNVVGVCLIFVFSST
jgi:hypothetical protein